MADEPTLDEIAKKIVSRDSPRKRRDAVAIARRQYPSQASQINKEVAIRLAELGVEAEKMDDPLAAVAYYEEALKYAKNTRLGEKIRLYLERVKQTQKIIMDSLALADKAQRKISEMDLVSAFDLIRKAIRKYPKPTNPLLFEILGKLRLAMGRHAAEDEKGHQNALHHFRKALESNPEDLAAWQGIIMRDAQLGDFKQALKDQQKMMKIVKDFREKHPYLLLETHKENPYQEYVDYSDIFFQAAYPLEETNPEGAMMLYRRAYQILIRVKHHAQKRKSWSGYDKDGTLALLNLNLQTAKEQYVAMGGKLADLKKVD